MIRSIDLAWLAGLFEGEGYIGIKRGRLVLVLSMTDKDVVQRAHTIAHVGVMYERKQRTKTGKQVWMWTVTRIEHAAGLAMTLYPLLGERRRQRIKEALASWKIAPLPRRLKTECIRGHPLSGDNLFIHEGRRRCRICRRMRGYAYRQRRKEAAA